MKCDMCGKRCSSQWDMGQLLNIYQTKDIQWVCNDCEKEINSHLWKVRGLYEPLVTRTIKRFMKFKSMEMHKKKCTRSLISLVVSPFDKGGEA
jgi:hypothetical protein